ncbi:MAG: hypothetical protein BAJALOKI2v1_250026 [Promethearchaeota archaeon]|nr:MAG: hypothetical protein BAJALOKI2v1_250026 [Candidatus Lokiarchaeota archaeon]
MEQSPIKIILFGLDNAGKTSIALCLQRKNNLSYFTDLSPTRGHDVVSFLDKKTNTQISIWDFGGQKEHRADHIKRLNEEFSIGASKLIYVIDIQDTQRYDLSLEYFGEILELIEKVDNNIKISVFLHKFDPNLTFDEGKISNLMDRIKKMIAPKFQYNIFKTSVYTIFSKKLAY